MAALSAGCEEESGPREGPGGSPAKAREVVVYCSADAPVAQPVFDLFQKRTGITVKPVFDTEATKTTGLVNRLLAEQGVGGADVWWSSEALGTIRLARAGVLEKYTSAITEASTRGGWPRELRGADGTWYGFARRLRVVIYNTKYVTEEDVPRFLRDLVRPAWKGRVGMARPQFGTTRGHMAALYGLDEGRSLRAWLEAMAANDLRLLDGNAAVARAVGRGELWLGLTDSDDALIGIKSGWPVRWAMVGDVCIEPWSIRAASAGSADPRGAEWGNLAPYPETPMQPPSTVAIVKGVKNRAEAEALVDFLLSEEGEGAIVSGEFQALRTERYIEMPYMPGEPTPGGWPPRPRLGISELSMERVADDVEAAMKVCEEVLRGR